MCIQAHDLMQTVRKGKPEDRPQLDRIIKRLGTVGCVAGHTERAPLSFNLLSPCLLTWPLTCCADDTHSSECAAHRLVTQEVNYMGVSVGGCQVERCALVVVASVWRHSIVDKQLCISKVTIHTCFEQ